MGKMFRFVHVGVVPDLIPMARGLAGGFPLSAVTGRAEVIDAAPVGGLGGTCVGNALAIAAAHAVLDVIAAGRCGLKLAAGALHPNPGGIWERVKGGLVSSRVRRRVAGTGSGSGRRLAPRPRQVRRNGRTSAPA